MMHRPQVSTQIGVSASTQLLICRMMHQHTLLLVLAGCRGLVWLHGFISFAFTLANAKSVLLWTPKPC